jgi:hypothetical protein
VPGFLLQPPWAKETSSLHSEETMRPQCCNLTPSITTVDAVLFPGKFDSSQSRRSVPLSQTLRFIL